MRRWFLSFVSIGISALAPAAALSADLVTKAPAIAPVKNWSGWYAGVNLGAGFLNSDWQNLNNTTLFGDSVPPDAFSRSGSGPVLGIQVGYNYQAAPWLFGIEWQLSGADINGKHASTSGAADDQFKVAINVLSSVSGRVGYAWNDWLAYAKGGYAIAEVKASVTDNVGPSTGSGHESAWHSGPTVGAGIEYALTPSLSLAVDYQYIWLDSGNYQLGGGAGSYLWKVDVRDIQLATLRLNYKFDWR